MDKLAKRFMAIDDSDALLCVLGGNTDPVIAMADCVYAYAAGIPIYTYIAGMESDIRPFVCISDNSSFEFSELLKEIGFFLS
jgi:hypothetical protein